ncbi:MAG: hypothetical protein U5K55_04355 [Aliarcobacter sp.]|nr:hypothetical protein [Aliarcobacter sp.]
MSYLTQKYIENTDLNYYEKKLFYNINTLSEDDFEIFFGIYKSYIEKTNQNNIVFEENIKKYENEEIIKISLFKFSNLGLLIYKDKSQEDGSYALEDFLGMPHYGEMVINKIIYYEKSNYSDNLFNLLKNYNDINDGIIESKSNEILKIK